MPKHGKKFSALIDKVDRLKHYPLDEALGLVKEMTFVKFDESVDLAINLGVNPKYSDQMVRGAAIMPHGTGKTIRVAVFAKGDKAQEAEEAGADIVGAEDLAEKIEGGFLDFDKTIATPDMMKVVGKLGRILGRRGLMPNPKVGTVTFDIAKAVKETKAGKVEFRVEKEGIIHVPVGKVSFEAVQLRENITSLIEAILKAKPSSAKGTYIKSVTVSSTMGPGLRLDVSELTSLMA
ncbi:MAG: 50S ribosomal protein L1 [Deltaproteobacteria bacterium]|nr:50S ribosomal protein L1 [Deltaproteobacteria bacterium]MBW1873468.1 50S ribosomal protein L1 [Deltaproteobacteria bacterium]